jgi:hypothetical protein
MPYLGNSPSSGGYHKLDSLTASATATYALTLGGSAYYPATANQLLVSLNGVIQAPQDSFTISGSNIVFASALSSSDSIDFIMSFGDVYNVGTPADGTITNAKIQSMAASKLTGALPAIDGSALTGLPAGTEYFEVDLTSDMTALTEATSVVVDFGGSGTVVYDTASNFDSANDAYLLDSSNGVYLINFSCALRSNALGNTSGDIIHGIAGIEIATDGSTFSGYKAEGDSTRNNDTDAAQTMTATGSFIYKATTATTKIRMTALCEMTSTDNWNIESAGAGLLQTSVTTNLNTAKVTWMSVMRIA